MKKTFFTSYCCQILVGLKAAEKFENTALGLDSWSDLELLIGRLDAYLGLQTLVESLQDALLYPTTSHYLNT